MIVVQHLLECFQHVISSPGWGRLLPLRVRDGGVDQVSRDCRWLWQRYILSHHASSWWAEIPQILKCK